MAMFFGTALLALALGSGDAAKLCERKCAAPKRQKHFAVFNATDGRLLEGGLRFPQADDIQLIFQKNPFKYSYRIGVVAQPLESGIATGFLSLIPGFAEILKGAGGSAAAPGRAFALPPPSACVGFETELKLLDDAELKDRTVESGTIKAELTELAGINDLYETFVQSTDTDQLSDPCAACVAASGLSGHIGRLIGLGNLPDRVAAFRKGVDASRARIEALRAKVPSQCLATLADAQRATLAAIAALPGDADRYADAVGQLQDNKESFERMARIIKTALAADNAFWEERYPQTAGQASELTINISTLNLRSSAPEVALDPIRLNIGESRLRLSAGIGFSTVDDVHIIRQPSLGENNAIVNRFGFERKSPFKPCAVVMLNSSLWSFGKQYSTGWNTGLVVSDRSSTAQVEYTAGWFFGFLRNTVFLNLGFHTARVEKLDGGFHTGDLVPATLPDPLPVQRNWAYGAMVSLTYRIR